MVFDSTLLITFAVESTVFVCIKPIFGVGILNIYLGLSNTLDF